MWCRKENRMESQDDFEALAEDVTANLEFSQSQENNAKKFKQMDSDAHHRKYSAWFQEKTWEKLKVRHGPNVPPCNSRRGNGATNDRAKEMPINQKESVESESIFTKYFVEKIIGMATKFSNLEKRFGEMEISLDTKLDKMEKMLICGQETVDRRMIEIETTLTRRIIEEIENKVMEKIIEEIDSKLKKMYESLHKRQKKCIDKQNTLNEKLNENSENCKFDDKLQQLESSIKTLLKNITEEIRDISFVGKPQHCTNFESNLILPQNTINTLKPQNQVLSNHFSHLPSPAVSVNDILSNRTFKKPQIPFRKRSNPMQPVIKRLPY